MTTLEDVARWHDDEALLADGNAYTAVSSGLGVAADKWQKDAAMHRVAAAACRELANMRRPMSMQIPGLRKKTDAALAEIE